MAGTIWVAHTLNDFGRLLGLDELAFNDRDTIQFAFEDWGVLGLEQGDTGVLVYLMRSFSVVDAHLYRCALQMCHYKETTLNWVQAALLRDRELAFSTWIPFEDFQLPQLEAAVTSLGEMHDLLSRRANQ